MAKKLTETDRQTYRHVDRLPKGFLVLHFAAKKITRLTTKLSWILTRAESRPLQGSDLFVMFRDRAGTETLLVTEAVSGQEIKHKGIITAPEKRKEK